MKNQWNENSTDSNWMNENRSEGQNGVYADNNRSNQMNMDYMNRDRNIRNDREFSDSDQQNADYMNNRESGQQNAGYMNNRESGQQNTGFMNENWNMRMDEPLPGTCGGLIHVIKAGDTLYKLSQTYHVSVSDIMYENPYVNIYNLQIGDELCIPVSKRQYR